MRKAWARVRGGRSLPLPLLCDPGPLLSACGGRSLDKLLSIWDHL